MLSLSFRKLGHSRSLDGDWFELRGSELLVGGRPGAVGHYSLGYWTYGNERWPYAECKRLIVIRCEDYDGRSGPVLGPRPSLRLQDRFVFVGRERVATLLPDGRWRIAGRDESWPILKVQPYEP
jgi:hypothetical protein